MDLYNPRTWGKGERLTAAGINRVEAAIGEISTELSGGSGVRSAAYTLGGTTSKQGYGTQQTTVRVPIRLTKTAQRVRLHIRNTFDLFDEAGSTGPTIGRVSFSRRSLAAGKYPSEADLIQLFPGKSGTLAGGGEVITDWLVPSWDTKNRMGHVSFVANFNGTGDVGTTYSSGGEYASGDAAEQTSGDVWTNYGSTPFSVYLEYEYEDDGAPQVLFLGDSISEGYYGGPYGQNEGPMRNFRGHIDSYAEAWARHTGGVAIINSYASAKIGDFWSGASKWNRFDKMATVPNPEAIVIHLGGNDFFQGAKYWDIVPQMEEWIRSVVKVEYPNAKIYIMGMMPLLASFTGSPWPPEDRVSLNVGFATMSRNLIDGYFEPDRIYDPTSGASENARSIYVSPDGLHLTPHAYELIAASIQLRAN